MLSLCLRSFSVRGNQDSFRGSQEPLCGKQKENLFLSNAEVLKDQAERIISEKSCV